MSKRDEVHAKLAAVVQNQWGADVNHFLANQRSVWVDRLTASYEALSAEEQADCLSRAGEFLHVFDAACPGWDKEPAPEPEPAPKTAAKAPKTKK